MNMSKDDFIKKKFQEDDAISDRVNQVFKDFKKNICTKNYMNSANINGTNMKNAEKQEKVISFFCYKNINKILSVAAVFLGVVLVRYGNISKK